MTDRVDIASRLTPAQAEAFAADLAQALDDRLLDIWAALAKAEAASHWPVFEELKAATEAVLTERGL